MYICTHLQITNKETEKKLALRTMNAAKINNAKKAIEEYKLMNSKYESTYKEFEEKIQTTNHKLKQVEESLKRMRPSIRLDSMQNRCEWLELTFPVCTPSLVHFILC